MTEPIRVLFIHGLESHPNGSKVRALREHFDVRCEDMKMSLLNVKKQNSVLRHLVVSRDTFVWLLLSFSGVTVLAFLNLWLGVAGFVAAIAFLVLSRRSFLGVGFERSLAACVEINREAIIEFEPDVLVGSSWGGAVALELVRREAWRGPLVVLAPAYVKAMTFIDARVGRPQIGDANVTQLRERSSHQPILILHDPTDDVVPFEDSVWMADGSAMTLRSMDAGGHRMLGTLEDGSLVAAVRESYPPT